MLGRSKWGGVSMETCWKLIVKDVVSHQCWTSKNRRRGEAFCNNFHFAFFARSYNAKIRSATASIPLVFHCFRCSHHHIYQQSLPEKTSRKHYSFSCNIRSTIMLHSTPSLNAVTPLAPIYLCPPSSISHLFPPSNNENIPPPLTESILFKSNNAVRQTTIHMFLCRRKIKTGLCCIPFGFGIGVKHEKGKTVCMTEQATPWTALSLPQFLSF